MSIHVRVGVANASESEGVRVRVDVLSVRRQRSDLACKLGAHTSENTVATARSN